MFGRSFVRSVCLTQNILPIYVVCLVITFPVFMVSTSPTKETREEKKNTSTSLSTEERNKIYCGLF